MPSLLHQHLLSILCTRTWSTLITMTRYLNYRVNYPITTLLAKEILGLFLRCLDQDSTGAGADWRDSLDVTLPRGSIRFPIMSQSIMSTKQTRLMLDSSESVVVSPELPCLFFFCTSFPSRLAIFLISSSPSFLSFLFPTRSSFLLQHPHHPPSPPPLPRSRSTTPTPHQPPRSRVTLLHIVRHGRD